MLPGRGVFIGKVQNVVELSESPVEVGSLPEHFPTARADEVLGDAREQSGRNRLQLHLGSAAEPEGVSVEGGARGPAAVRRERGPVRGPRPVMLHLSAALIPPVVLFGHRVLNQA